MLVRYDEFFFVCAPVFESRTASMQWFCEPTRHYCRVSILTRFGVNTDEVPDIRYVGHWLAQRLTM